MSVLNAILRLNTGTYTVTRPTSDGAYDSTGAWVPGAGSTFTAVASVQPVTGTELQNLPEGQHSMNTRKMYTATELRTRTGADPDTVAIDGETWTVISVERWQHRGETFYKAMIARQDLP